MFSHRIKIGLGGTDATGALFFPEQFVMAMHTLEAFLESKRFPLSDLLKSPYLFPVVHAEADYLKPLAVCDEIEITFQVEKVGISSVHCAYLLHRLPSFELVGSVHLVHVVIDRQSKEKMQLPSDLKTLFLSDSQKGRFPQEV